MDLARNVRPMADRRKMLAFRAWHRGTREADLLVGRFADAVLPELDEAGLNQFEDLLACPDPDLYDWVTRRATPPVEHDHPVLHLLREFSLARPDRQAP